ncbi:MAG: efflux RND transporter periplasmic adaptor subunit [Bacillota bacterium]|nr:efflux RND transporter periplasmic adaptor subunit [Bacillota bacterium]
MRIRKSGGQGGRRTGPVWKKWSRKKKIAALVAMVLLIALAAWLVLGPLTGGTAAATEYMEYTVSRGDVSVSISGTGTVSPINSYEVVSTVAGEVLTDTFEEGDSVTEGDVLYTIDSSDMEDTIAKANISYERSLMTYEDSQKAYTGLTVTATGSGKVAQVYVSKGDSVQSGTQIAQIVDDSYMTATVAFSETDAASLYVGQSITAVVENTFETISGTITSIGNGTRVAEGYMTVRDVEVRIANPGYLSEGTYVSVTAGDASCQETAPLEYNSSRTVKAEASGTVSKIVASAGTTVSIGDTLVILENEDAADSLRSSQLTMQEAEMTYQNTQEQLDDYTITAPISGSIISKSVKAGDTIDSGNTQTTMATIADMSQFTFTINVDELDISQMEVGQKVLITADALSDVVIEGEVSAISISGTYSNGVTNYPVKIVFEPVDGLLPGMNVSAEIVVDSAEDVLLIPSTAVNRGNTVLMADGEERAVSLGLSDASNIEVTEGLEEGEVIQVPVSIGSDDSSVTEEMGGMMMMDGGSMPSGDMPSGGSMPSGGGGAPGGF